MKKITSLILVLILAFSILSLVSCGGAKGGAAETEREKTEEEIIDEILQGTWTQTFKTIVQKFKFENGRVVGSMVISDKEMKANEGDYRIDTEKSAIYIKWDNTITIGGENNGNVRPNTEEKEFPYTYKNGELVIHNNIGSEVLDIVKEK